MKNQKLNLCVILLSLAVMLVYIFAVDGAGSIIEALQETNFQWITGAIGLMVLYWLLEAMILHLAVKRFHGVQKFGATLQTSMVGQLFNCLTPFASGGQPMQACYMVRSGVPLGVSASTLTLKFVVYQFVLTLYSLVTIIWKFDEFSKSISHLKYLVLVGFAVNTAVICGLLCLCFCRGPTRRFLTWSIRLLHRLRIIKDEEKTQQSLDGHLNQFYECFAAMKQNIPLIVKMAALSAVQLTAFFLISYMLFRSFGIGSASWFSMLAAQAFVLNVSSFVPLPGAAGGAELSFYTMFAMFFPLRLLGVSVLLWRLITFYLPICVGALFVFDYSKKNLVTE